MRMKITAMITVLIFLLLSLSFFADAESAACRDYNSDCVNGGCANFNYTEACTLYCIDVLNPTKTLTIQCKVPGEVGQDDDSEPTTAAP